MSRSFGYKCAWIAVRTESPLTVATALGLRNLRPSSWEEGIAAAYRYEPKVILARHAFLTPPIDDWVLCASTAFFNLETEQQLVPFLCDLSRQLRTVVQCFQTHRVVESHTWGCAEDGKLTRLYGYIGERGETLFDIGDQTNAEISLGFKFFVDRSSEASKPSYWEGQDLTFPDEGHVMQLAGKWSIDPTTLDEREADDGWLGETTGNQEQEPPKRPWWKLWR